MPFTSIETIISSSQSNGLGGSAILPSSVAASISSVNAASSRSVAQASITAGSLTGSSQNSGSTVTVTTSLTSTIDVISQIRVAGTDSLLVSQEVEFYLEQLTYTTAPTSIFRDVYSAATRIASETDDASRQVDAQAWSASVLNIITSSPTSTSAPSNSTASLISSSPVSGSNSDTNSSIGSSNSIFSALIISSIGLLAGAFVL